MNSSRDDGSLLFVYIGRNREDDGEPFEEKMARLTSELDDLFKQSHELEAEIRKKMTAIGFEM